VIGSALPAALRAFLLTLAVVDDLGAITVIAVFYTETIDWKALSTAAVGLALWWFLQHRRVHVWWAYLPLAFVIWAFVHESGIHATVAGVAMGLLTRVRPDPGETHPPVEQLEHRVRPWSAGVAVPAFAFCAAGVRVVGSDLGAIVDDPVVPGIVLALCLGKALGVFGGTYVIARFTRAELSSDLEWGDVVGVATLSGVGFTVSLLIGELAFDDPTRVDHVKIAVLVGSLLSAVAASVLLRRRNQAYANS
jgi:NhaA family Na+:H+ antiporter